MPNGKFHVLTAHRLKFIDARAQEPADSSSPAADVITGEFRAKCLNTAQNLHLVTGSFANKNQRRLSARLDHEIMLAISQLRQIKTNNKHEQARARARQIKIGLIVELDAVRVPRRKDQQVMIK